MSRCLFFARLAILFASFTASADEVILLDPSADRQTEFQVPLFGYREFPQQIFTSQKGENFGLPTELIYTSASRIPEVEEEATSKGTDIFDLDAGQVVALLRSRSVDEIAPTPGISRPTTNIPWTESSEVDAAFVTALVSSELVRSDFSIFYGEIIGDKAVEMISVDREVAKDFWDAYSNLEGLKMYDPFERVNQFQRIEATLVQYPVLLEAAKINFSPVSFGEIFVYSSDERGLQIPPPIARKYDVYWVEFPMSLRDLGDDYVVEVSFHVFLPEDSRALDLIPRRFGIEAEIEEGTKSPEVGFKEITVGEFYSKTVSYTTLKPIIVATGLREHQFSWVLTEEAISTGSYLFVGIIGVPKDRCSVNAGLGVNAKTTDFLGLQGDVAGTGVIFTEIALPC